MATKQAQHHQFTSEDVKFIDSHGGPALVLAWLESSGQTLSPEIKRKLSDGAKYSGRIPMGSNVKVMKGNRDRAGREGTVTGYLGPNHTIVLLDGEAHTIYTGNLSVVK